MSYLANLLDALMGRAKTSVDGHSAELSARLATLEMDLRERDRRITAMQREYAQLEAAGKRATAGAGQEQLEHLFQKLSTPLANLSALAAFCDAGREVAAADLVSLVRSLEKQLKAAGLEQVGVPGESVPFDVARHRSMSGGTLAAGTPAVVHTPGYRCGKKVLLKAMVAPRGAGS